MSLRWDAHFLELALECARMSKDPSTRVGAIIVGPDREIRSTGFNGFPRGIEDRTERLQDRSTKLLLIVHAEQNAICNAARVGVSLKACALYLAATDDTGAWWGGAPCTRCTVELIQAGITKVVSWPIREAFSKWHEDIAFARTLLEEAGVAFCEVPTV